MRVGEVAGWLGRLVQWWVVEWCGGMVVVVSRGDMLAELVRLLVVYTDCCFGQLFSGRAS